MPGISDADILRLFQVADEHGKSLTDIKVLAEISEASFEGFKSTEVTQSSREKTLRTISRIHELATLLQHNLGPPLRDEEAEKHLLPRQDHRPSSFSQLQMLMGGEDAQFKDFDSLLEVLRTGKHPLRADIGDGPSFGEGALARKAGAFAAGLGPDFIRSLPFGESISTGLDKITSMSMDEIAAAERRDPSFFRTIGGIAPTIAMGTSMMKGLVGKGFGKIPSAITTFGTLGVLGAGEGRRGEGLILGGITGGVLTKAQMAVMPVVKDVWVPYVLGVTKDPNRVQKMMAWGSQALAQVLTDTSVFTGLTAMESALHGKFDMSFKELFLSNMAVVGFFQTAGGIKSRITQAGREARSTVRDDIQKAFADQGPLGASGTRDALLSKAPDAVMIELAFRSSLAGARLTPEVVKTLIQKGPSALRKILTPEQMQGVFAKDIQNLDKVRTKAVLEALAERKLITEDDKQGLLDVMARITPKDSVADKVLETVPSKIAMEVADMILATGAALHPRTILKLPDFTSPDGYEAIRQSVMSMAPEVRGLGPVHSQFVKGHPMEFNKPLPIEGFRMFRNTAKRLLHSKDADQLLEAYQRASTSQARRSEINLTWFNEHWGTYLGWLKQQPVEAQWTAVQRLIFLQEGRGSLIKEQGAPFPLHPVENRMLTAMDQLLGKYKRIFEAKGKPVMEEGYFPHMWTLAQKQELNLPRAAGPKGGMAGYSRHLKRRLFNREDYSIDIGEVIKSYILSAEKQIAWEPVNELTENLIRSYKTPQTEARIRELERKIRRKNRQIRGEQIPKLKSEFRKELKFMETQKSKLMETSELPAESIDFLRTQAKLAAGALPESKILPAIDWIGEKAAKLPGLHFLQETNHPGRAMLRGVTAFRYFNALGFSFGSAMKNSTQNINSIGRLGLNWWGKGVKNHWEMEVVPNNNPNFPWRLQIKLNPLIKQVGLFNSTVITEIESAWKPLRSQLNNKAVRKLMDASMWMFQHAEQFNRGSAFLGGYYKALNDGLSKVDAIKFGKRIAAETQFDYGKLGGQVYQGPVGNAVMQFMRFGNYQMDFMGQQINRFMTQNRDGLLPSERTWAPAFRYAVGMVAADWAMNGMGFQYQEFEGPGSQMPEAVRFPIQFGAERIGQIAGRSKGFGKGAETKMLQLLEQGRITPQQTRRMLQLQSVFGSGGGVRGAEIARRGARDLGFESMAPNMSQALLRSMGPAVSETLGLTDVISLSPTMRIRAMRDLESKTDLLKPFGLNARRFEKFLQEHKDGFMRDRGGRRLFDISEHESIVKLFGLPSFTSNQMYDSITDLRRVVEANVAMRTKLNEFVRNELRTMIADGMSPEEARYNAGGLYILGHTDIKDETGIVIPGEVLGSMFKVQILKQEAEADKLDIFERQFRKLLGPVEEEEK